MSSNRIQRGRDIFDISAFLFVVSCFAVLVLSAQRYAAVGSDFAADYAAARAVRSGESIYGDQLAKRQLEFGFAGSIPNNHPPTSILPFLPFSALGADTAFLAFNCFSLLLYVSALAIALRREQLDRRKRAGLLLFFLLWPPTFSTLALGQSSLIVGAAIILGWSEFRRSSNRLSAALVSAAGLIKLFPFFVLSAFLRTRRAELIGAVLVILVGASCTLAVVGIADFETYFSVVLPYHQAESRMIPFNLSLSGMILPLFLSGPWSRPLVEAPALGTALSVVAQVIVAGVTVKTIWFSEKQRGSFDSYSFCAVAALLISPIAWGHYLFLAIPAFLNLELSRAKTEQNFGRIGLIVIVGSSAIRFQDWAENGMLDWYQCLPGKVSGVVLFAIWVLLVRKGSSSGHHSFSGEPKRGIELDPTVN